MKPAFDEFILPVQYIIVLNFFLLTTFQTKKYADIIIPRGSDNQGKLVPCICVVLMRISVAIDILTLHIANELKQVRVPYVPVQLILNNLLAWI